MALINRELRSRNKRRCDDGVILKRPCRSLLLLMPHLPHMRVVTDPKRLTALKAEAARRKQIIGRNCKFTHRRPTS
jgi:hypothetical protein